MCILCRVHGTWEDGADYMLWGLMLRPKPNEPTSVLKRNTAGSFAKLQWHSRWVKKWFGTHCNNVWYSFIIFTVHAFVLSLKLYNVGMDIPCMDAMGRGSLSELPQSCEDLFPHRKRSSKLIEKNIHKNQSNNSNRVLLSLFSRIAPPLLSLRSSPFLVSSLWLFCVLFVWFFVFWLLDSFWFFLFDLFPFPFLGALCPQPRPAPRQDPLPVSLIVFFWVLVGVLSLQCWFNVSLFLALFLFRSFCFLIHIILVFGAEWRLRRLRVLNASTNVDLFLVPGGWGNIPEGNIKTAMLLDTKCTWSSYLVLTNRQLFGRRLPVGLPKASHKLWRNKPSENPRLPRLCGAKRWMTKVSHKISKLFPTSPLAPPEKHAVHVWGLLPWWSMILLMVQRSQGQPIGLGCFWSPGKIIGFQVPTGPTGEPDFWTINSIFWMFPG